MSKKSRMSLCYERENYRFVYRHLMTKYGVHAFDMLKYKKISESEQQFIEANIIPKKDDMEYVIDLKSNDTKDVIRYEFGNKVLSNTDKKLINTIVTKKESFKRSVKTVFISLSDIQDFKTEEKPKKESKPKKIKPEKVQCKAIKMDGTRCTAMVLGGCLCGKHNKKN